VGGFGIDTDAVKLYDAFAPYYREYSLSKSAYLTAVEKYVVEHLPENASTLLDVGAGDGIRGMIIAGERKIGHVVLAEPSSEMADRCRKLPATEVWQLPAEELPTTDARFDVIICLWNVLGHIGTRYKRIEALKRMRRMLDDEGRLFLDVNNRHNASAYGSIRVLGRRFIDAIRPDERRGDATFHWKVGEKTMTSMGHLFTPKEVEGLFRASGLRVKNRVSVNYATGAISASISEGQLLYALTRSASDAAKD
jgi:ubiquinone/menaquinone biosynthesis C-methylase UbiE